MEVLAIVARSGKFLPVCLTFGPVNGPDDFCYVVDRAFGPGRGRKNRYTREWVAYVDDLTIRTGRVVDGSFRTDAEHEEEVRRAMRDAPVTVGQPARDALEALGVQAEALGTKGKHDPKVSDHNHPRITSDLRVGFALGCGTFLGFGLGGPLVLGRFLGSRAVRFGAQRPRKWGRPFVRALEQRCSGQTREAHRGPIWDRRSRHHDCGTAQRRKGGHADRGRRSHPHERGSTAVF